MAFSKTPLYNERDRKTSFFAKALSHPARLSIIRRLSHEGPCDVATLKKNHPISQPTLSQHLRILRKAQIVEYKEKYPFTYYYLNSKNFNKAKRQLKSYLEEIFS